MGAEIAYTGGMEFDLRSRHGVPVATVDVVIRQDVAKFDIAGRNMATIDREQLRDWLIGRGKT